MPSQVTSKKSAQKHAGPPPRKASVSQPYRITVDYSQSLEQMIAAGKYEGVDEDFTAERFLVRGQGTIASEIVLINFNWRITTKRAVHNMKRLDLRPATLPELLAFGATHPAAERARVVVALGSTWENHRGHPHVPCVGVWAGQRRLELTWSGVKWNWRSVFAAVRTDGPAA